MVIKKFLHVPAKKKKKYEDKKALSDFRVTDILPYRWNEMWIFF
jgi:hypothetical protein